MTPDPAGCFNTADSREFDVHQNEVDLPATCQGNGLFPAAGLEQFKIAVQFGDPVPHCTAKMGVVVDDHHHARPGGRFRLPVRTGIRHGNPFLAGRSLRRLRGRFRN